MAVQLRATIGRSSMCRRFEETAELRRTSTTTVPPRAKRMVDHYTALFKRAELNFVPGPQEVFGFRSFLLFSRAPLQICL
jgi:hypothetical protein